MNQSQTSDNLSRKADLGAAVIFGIFIGVLIGHVLTLIALFTRFLD